MFTPPFFFFFFFEKFQYLDECPRIEFFERESLLISLSLSFKIDCLENEAHISPPRKMYILISTVSLYIRRIQCTHTHAHIGAKIASIGEEGKGR